MLVESNRRAVKISLVRDGTSNTILVGEKHLHDTHLGGLDACCTDNEPVVNVGWESDLFRRGSQTPLPDKSNDSGFTLRFGSAHAGGVNVVMVDGSVQFVPWQVEDKVFLNLCLRADGNPVTLD
jgi:prepilin-type processing-associated H-X9-DG protein